MQNTRPSDQGTYAVKAETPDEDRLVTIMAENPIRMAKRCKRIRSTYKVRRFVNLHEMKAEGIPKVSCLKPRRPSSCNMKCVLKMLVERIEETITEAPQKEKSCDKSKRIN